METLKSWFFFFHYFPTSIPLLNFSLLVQHFHNFSLYYISPCCLKSISHLENPFWNFICLHSSVWLATDENAEGSVRPIKLHCAVVIKQLYLFNYIKPNIFLGSCELQFLICQQSNMHLIQILFWDVFSILVHNSIWPTSLGISWQSWASSEDFPCSLKKTPFYFFKF